LKAIAEACANIGSRPVPPTHRNYAKYIRYRGKTVKQILAEIGVYHPEYLISGLVDILFVKGDEFFILDWKTNKAPIRFEGGYWAKKADGTIDLDKYIITNETMLFPINHLQDSTGIHYSLQLSMYDYLIEQWGI